MYETSTVSVELRRLRKNGIWSTMDLNSETRDIEVFDFGAAGELSPEERANG